tara:strand:- start:1541 stop:1771 length:231 start_codon:yes stop_codon:yes gene_type:complete
MKEFFMMGMLCLINPMTGQEHCAFIHEDPIIYYPKNICEEKVVKKVNEMGVNLTKKGFEITELYMNCLVDKNRLNT